MFSERRLEPGRDAQSIAFFSPPGTEPLYSGVAKRIASAEPHASRRRATDSGGSLVSRSWSYSGSSRDAGRIEELDLDALRGGLDRRPEEARVVASRRAGCRRRPGPSLLGLRLDERELGDELHVVGEVVATALVRRVPADAVLRAVDRGLELQADALTAERIGRGLGDDAFELDRQGRALERELALALDAVVLEAVELRRLESDLGVPLASRRSPGSGDGRSAARP